MRFLFYVLLIFSVVSCSLNAIILNLIFGVCCSFLVLLNLLIILFHDLFFMQKLLIYLPKKCPVWRSIKLSFIWHLFSSSSTYPSPPPVLSWQVLSSKVKINFHISCFTNNWISQTDRWTTWRKGRLKLISRCQLSSYHFSFK